MYPNQMGFRPGQRPYRQNPSDNRFIGGGFLGPFLLGGITGGLIAPAFYPRPYYQPYPMYPPCPQCYYRPF